MAVNLAFRSVLQLLALPQFLVVLLLDTTYAYICFKVKVIGTPVPELSWYLNDQNIDDNEDVVITYDRQSGYCTLLFVDIMPEDSGVYTYVFFIECTCVRQC